MKKILSLLLTLTLLLGMTHMVFATTSGELTDGVNTIELPWDTDEASVYTYTATQTGTLYIAALEFYSAIGDYDYADNSNNMYEWQDCTEFTVDGQLLDGIYYGSVEVVEGQTYTFSWAHGADVVNKSWYILGWKAVIDLSYSDDAIPKPGSEEMPVELYPDDCPTVSLEIPAGGAVWYMIYEFNDAEFVVTGENAYVSTILFNQETWEQEEVYLEAENGEVVLPVNSYKVLVQIGNTGQEPAVFHLSYRYPLGSESNPDELVMGENVASVEAGSYEGYTYEWTAQCDGVLTLTMPEKNWTLIVYNMTTWEEGMWYDSPGENVITVDVKKGEVFWICINNFDEMAESFVGGVVNFTAAVAYDHSFVDGACEHCGAPEVQVEPGDVNGDGRVNSRDARMILMYLAGAVEEDAIDLVAADVNNDGRINSRDARAILMYIAG